MHEKNLRPLDHVNCKIIMFQVRIKEILGHSQHDKNSLIQLCREGGTIQLWDLEHWISIYVSYFYANFQR